MVRAHTEEEYSDEYSSGDEEQDEGPYAVSMLDSILSRRDYLPPHHITNVVCTFTLGCEDIDLVKLAQRFDFVTYNPNKFAAGIIRNRNPKTSFLVFRTGTAVCTGAKTIQQSRYGAQLLCGFFMDHGMNFVMTKFRVRNVVGTMWCPFRLDLAGMYKTNMVEDNVKCSYVPDLFPGLIMRIADPKSVSLVFQTGKVVCTGAQSQEGIECAFDYAYRHFFRHHPDRCTSDEFVQQLPKFPGQKQTETLPEIIGPKQARQALQKERDAALGHRLPIAAPATPNKRRKPKQHAPQSKESAEFMQGIEEMIKTNIADPQTSALEEYTAFMPDAMRNRILGLVDG